MALIPTSNVVKVAIVGQKDEQEIVNIIHIHSDELLPSYGECFTAANTVMKWFETEALPILSNEYRVNYTEARGIYQSETPVAYGFPVGSGVGGAAVASEPNAVTLATSFRTGMTGRANRGRNYWPAITSTNVFDQNEVLLTYSALILGAYATLNAYLAAEMVNAYHVIVSLYLNNAPRLNGVFRAVTNYLHTDLTLDSMRRRKPGEGI